MQKPSAVTLTMLIDACSGGTMKLSEWLEDPKHARLIPNRMKLAGYVPFRNPAAKDRLWKIAGRRQVVYVNQELSVNERQTAVDALMKEKVAQIPAGVVPL
jgi:hypothetical protein